MNNIIVFGLKRTGTSLMVQILGENGEYIINKDNIQPILVLLFE